LIPRLVAGGDVV